MAVAAEYQIGQTNIKICDDHCKDQTQEDVDKILKNVTRIVSKNLEEQMQRELREKAI